MTGFACVSLRADSNGENEGKAKCERLYASDSHSERDLSNMMSAEPAMNWLYFLFLTAKRFSKYWFGIHRNDHNANPLLLPLLSCFIPMDLNHPASFHFGQSITVAACSIRNMAITGA